MATGWICQLHIHICALWKWGTVFSTQNSRAQHNNAGKSARSMAGPWFHIQMKSSIVSIEYKLWGLSQRKWFMCIFFFFFSVKILLQAIVQIKLHLIYFFFLVKATCAFEQANSCSVCPNCSWSIACWEKTINWARSSFCYRTQQLVVM